jgi:hypothetical protein
MNWIFEAFSNVYKVAMMRNTGHPILFAFVKQKPRQRSHGRLSRRV